MYVKSVRCESSVTEVERSYIEREHETEDAQYFDDYNRDIKKQTDLSRKSKHGHTS
jgi:hypothetical protein